MDKRHIARFLKTKKRGVYTLIVQMYQEIVNNANATIALELIQEDLEAATGEKIVLNYFSLSQAIKRSKTRGPKVSDKPRQTWDFKDTNELSKEAMPLGKFKL